MAARLLRPGSAQSMERWGQPLKVIFMDYVEVARDVAAGVRQRPIRALLYSLAAGLLGTSWRRNPDLAGFENDVLEYSNELSMCSKSMRSPHAQAYIEKLISLKSDGYLRHVSLGICSVVLQRVSVPDCDNYHEVCPLLQPRLWTAHERVVDVGLWGKWQLLERNMADFDINEEQLEKSLANQNS